MTDHRWKREIDRRKSSRRRRIGRITDRIEEKVKRLVRRARGSGFRGGAASSVERQLRRLSRVVDSPDAGVSTLEQVESEIDDIRRDVESMDLDRAEQEAGELYDEPSENGTYYEF